MEEKLEEVVEETTQPTVEKVEETVDETKFESAGDDSVMKIDLSKPPKPKKQNETKEDNPDDKGVVGVDEDANATEKQEEIQSEEQTQEEAPVLEEITEEEVKEETETLTEELLDAKIEEVETGKAMPEDLQKVVDFMEETGGTLEDYVKLNQDFTNYDDKALLKEYYKNTKSHLTSDEIDFLIEDDFSYDEEVDEERDIKKKKIALKEQVANAKSHLDGQKSKYYEEIKAGSKLTQEQQKAVNFFNRYNKESEETQKIAEKHGLSLSELSLAFINQLPFVTSNIIGATKMSQLKENINSINIDLSDEILAEIEVVHQAIPNPAP